MKKAAGKYPPMQFRPNSLKKEAKDSSTGGVEVKGYKPSRSLQRAKKIEKGFNIRDSYYGGQLLGAGVAAGGGALGLAGMKYHTNKMPRATIDDLRKLRDSMGLKAPITRAPGVSFLSGPHYMPGSWFRRKPDMSIRAAYGNIDIPRAKKWGVVAIPEGGAVPLKSVLGVGAHELGHATPGKLKKILGKMYNLPIAAGIGTASTVGAAVFDPDSTASKVMPYVAPVGFVPILAEEARASLTGYKGLKKHRLASGVKIPKGTRRALAGAFLTYGAAAGGSLAAALGARKLRKYLDKSVDKRYSVAEKKALLKKKKAEGK